VSGAGSGRLLAALAVREIEGAGSLLPVAAAFGGRDGSFWLDSALADARLGRFSFFGADPYAVARVRGGWLSVEVRRPVRPDLAPGPTPLGSGPFEALSRLLPPAPAEDPAPGLPFAGGAVGWLGYELGAALEPRLALRGRDGLDLPDLGLLLVDRCLALEHASGRRFACALGFAAREAAARERAHEALAAWSAELEHRERAGPAPEARAAPPPAPGEVAFVDAAAYEKAVADLLERIAAGDLYQACLTHRIERPFAGDPFHLYLALRAANPAPFGAWLALPELRICSSSPERFLRLEPSGAVESRPIKGTRPRAADPLRDRTLARELLTSEKDRAENLMIVDLVRHDLGRVCETGSVSVPELRVLESYATVHQMVSTVRGRLRPEAGLADLLRAAFPPGSMTGAPKLAAMQQLARLEPVRRGVYAGALGYFDARGGADLSVVIRTALVAGGRAFVHTGGGIVADSEAGAEWRESLDKARALLAALDAAGGGS
jgi:aminodeoxychorismate synthase component I